MMPSLVTKTIAPQLTAVLTDAERVLTSDAYQLLAYFVANFAADNQGWGVFTLPQIRLATGLDADLVLRLCNDAALKQYVICLARNDEPNPGVFVAVGDSRLCRFFEIGPSVRDYRRWNPYDRHTLPERYVHAQAQLSLHPIHRSPIFLRDGLQCQYCGQLDAPSYHIDHIIPRLLGGRTRSYNLVVACAACNLRKNADVWIPRNLDAITTHHPRHRDLVLELAIPHA